MCGIFGYLNFDPTTPAPPYPTLVNAALDSMHHRGPDERGTWHAEEIALGMCRLSIIDLASGQQPIWNEDNSICIIYNGELYNYQDLRPELETRGHVFRTKSDTEVVLHAYEEWGPACLSRFNGMFALAIWNTRERTLFLARDRVGEKPLYYFQDAHRLIFASEIKTILTERSVPRQMNLQGLANYLTFGHALAPTTIYQGIYKLLPGHYMLVKNGQVEINAYWDVGSEPQLDGGKALSEDEYAERLLALLDDSVRRRMIADVPLGAFLSGGVDSSSIVALMVKHASGPVKTFALGFTVGGAYNELEDARRVAQAFGTEHHELLVEHTDLVAILQKLVYHYDEPYGDAASFPLYLLSQFARQHVKVALSGDGGDELFGGYRRYAADQFANLYQLLPGFLTHRVIPSLADSLPRLRRVKQALNTLPIADPAHRYAAWLTWFDSEMLSKLLQPEVFRAVQDYDAAACYPHYYNHLNGKTASDHLNRLMYVDFKTWLPDTYMEKLDKATMACSLEGRVPFLDHRLVELAFQIPSQYKIKGLSTKLILKRAVSKLVPPSVLEKPKHGFAVPTDPWFRGNLQSFTREILFDQRTRQRGLLNTAEVERLWQEHVSGRHVWDTQLWLLLNLELWFRAYMDGVTV